MLRALGTAAVAVAVAVAVAMASMIPGVSRAGSYAEFLAAWPGDYDNRTQVMQQRAAGVPESARNRELELHIRRVELPAFGRDVYYAEWRRIADGSKPERQRIYAFSPTPDGTGYRLDLEIWPQNRPDFAARTAGAYEHPERLADVTPADMAGLKGCDVTFGTAGPPFAGAMQKGSCAFTAPDGTALYSWSQMKIGPTGFRYLDGWFRRDGGRYSSWSTTWYEFNRRRAAQRP